MTDDLNDRKKFYREHLKIRNNLHNWKIMNYAPIQCSRLYNQGLLDHFFSASGLKDHEKSREMENIVRAEKDSGTFWRVKISGTWS